MKKLPIDYSQIDSGIRDVIRTWNTLPFVYTQSSCEGHLRRYSAMGRGLRADPGKLLLFGGHIIFKLDESHKKAHAFLTELKSLKSSYPFVVLDVHSCGEPSCEIEGSQYMDFDNSDLTRHNKARDDSLEEMLRVRHQVPIVVGEKRIAEYREVWVRCLEMARKHGGK